MSCAPVRYGNLHNAVKHIVQSQEWCTSSLIAAQVTIPPEAVARHGMYHSTVKNEWSCKTSLVCKVLYPLYKQGIVERRKNIHGRFEYKWKVDTAPDST